MTIQDNYWQEIINFYRQLPDYLSPQQKWEQAYKHMRELHPHHISTVPAHATTPAREYAMAIRACMVYRFSHLILSKDFFKRWI